MPFGILDLTLFPFILGAWAAFWLLAAELWLCAEFWIAAVSGAVVLCQLAERQGRPRMSRSGAWGDCPCLPYRRPIRGSGCVWYRRYGCD